MAKCLLAYQGSPLGPSTTVSSDGAASDRGASGVTGYTVTTAPDLSAATEKAKGCPVLTSGGSIAVHEALEMG
jgi:hypothetical protein